MLLTTVVKVCTFVAYGIHFIDRVQVSDAKHIDTVSLVFIPPGHVPEVERTVNLGYDHMKGDVIFTPPMKSSNGKNLLP